MLLNDNAVSYSVYDIELWKSKLLEYVVDAFATQHQGEIQKSISAWRWSDELPFPTINDISVNGGSLAFEVLVADCPVFFSLWYTLGETRVGVRIPQKLLLLGDLSKKISLSYDGSNCQKITQQGDKTFFDWIFRDDSEGFSSFNTGIKAAQNKIITIGIASKLADVLVHIYMSTMNILIEGRNLKVAFKHIQLPINAKYYEIKVSGDLEAFEYHNRNRGSVHKKTSLPGSPVVNYIIIGKENTSLDSFPLGAGELDGGWYHIMERRELLANNVVYN